MADDCVALHPGEQVDVAHGAIGATRAVDAEAAAAWLQQRLAVDDAPVAEVLETLQR